MSEMDRMIQEYQSQEGAVLVDLRDAPDYEVGHIPGAVNFTLSNLRDGIRRIAKFNSPIYLYCYTGNRSDQGETLLRAKGYTNARSIGGIDRYTGALDGPAMTIRDLRRAKGLSQAAFAAAIGVRQPTVAAYECGKANPSPKTVEQIRALFGVNLVRTEKKAAVIIQNATGKTISPEEIRKKTGPADMIIVRPDLNEAYWTRGRFKGTVKLWDD